MRNLVTKHEGILERVSSQIQISVFRSDVITSVALVLDGERRGNRLVQDMDCIEFNLDLTCIHLRVLALTLDNLALYLNDEFTSERVCSLDQFSRCVCTYDQLSNSVAVTEVNESHSAQFSGSLHPTGKHHFFAGVSQTELAASVCSVKSIEHNMLDFYIFLSKHANLVNYRKKPFKNMSKILSLILPV